jgi:hypothetical protein
MAAAVRLDGVFAWVDWPGLSKDLLYPAVALQVFSPWDDDLITLITEHGALYSIPVRYAVVAAEGRRPQPISEDVRRKYEERLRQARERLPDVGDVLRGHHEPAE